MRCNARLNGIRCDKPAVQFWRDESWGLFPGAHGYCEEHRRDDEGQYWVEISPEEVLVIEVQEE